MTTALARLAQIIEYPEEVPAGTLSFTFWVDGVAIEAMEEHGKIRLMRHLPITETTSLSQLAGYATGRMLKEEAVLSWDPTDESPLLWQDIPSTADSDLLRRFFEVFTASCDWWADRTAQDIAYAQVPEMMIRP